VGIYFFCLYLLGYFPEGTAQREQRELLVVVLIFIFFSCLSTFASAHKF